MAYERTTWVDEILDDVEQFEVLDSAGAAVDAFAELATCKIQLETTIDTEGTPIDAEHLNNMEEGIVALATGAGRSVKGVALGAGSDIDDIVAGTDGHVLRRLGADIGFGETVAAGIANDAIETAKMKDASVTLAKLSAAVSAIITREAARVDKNGTQAIDAPTQAVITSWTTNFDDNSLWDAANNQFVIKKAGLYFVLFTGAVTVSRNCQARIRHRRGATQSYIDIQAFSRTLSTTPTRFKADGLMVMEVDDEIDFTVLNDEASASITVAASVEFDDYTMQTYASLIKLF